VAYTGNSSINNPLHLAAAKNRSAFITAFLELEKEEVESDARKSYIPCVMQTNENYLTPLFLAVLNDHVKCVEALLKSSDEISQLDVVDRDGNSVIHICAKNNSVEILRHLIMKHPSVLDSIFIVNNAKELPLHIAASLGHIEIFKLILQKFIDGMKFNSIQNNPNIS
jgi:ankyrin repeat protein